MEGKNKKILYAHRSKNLFVTFVEETNKLVAVEYCGIVLLMGKEKFHSLFKRTVQQ